MFYHRSNICDRTTEHSFSFLLALIYTIIHFTHPLLLKVVIHSLGHCRHVLPMELVESVNQLDKFTACALDICEFNSGMLWGMHGGSFANLVKNLRKRNQTMYAMHANFVSGNSNKQMKLDSVGLWLANRTNTSSTTCLRPQSNTDAVMHGVLQSTSL